MFSLGMVIHFMAFKGKLPYISSGETLESLESLRQEVQSYAGYISPVLFSPRLVIILMGLGTNKTMRETIYLMSYMNYYDYYCQDNLINVLHVKKSSI